MANDPTWNFLDPACKPRLLGTLRGEAEDVLKLASDPKRWDAPTACAGWQVRDVVGHLVDATEGYFPGFDIAYNGGSAPEPLGLRSMAKLADDHAKSFRKATQDEMLDRLHDDFARAMREFESLTADDWLGLQVHHPFMGPIPSGFFPIFQLVDYAVHGWDIRQGTGEPHAMAAESADLLAPLIFVLWQATADTSSVTTPFSVGVRLSGVNGGETRLDVSNEGVQFAPGDVSDCAAVLDFDPATFVLTGYGRMNGGTVSGDREAAAALRRLFFAI